MKRLLGSVLALVALCACTEKEAPRVSTAPVDAGVAELAEQEPNEGPDQALTLSGDSIVNAALSAEPARPDEDWYALTSSAPRQVDLEVSGVSGADIVVSFYDQDRNPLASVNSEGEGGAERFPNLLVKDRVLVKVSAAKKGTGGAYTVTARYADVLAGSELEPNERAVDATPLPLGASARGFLGHAGDEDWYRIELPHAALVLPTDPGLPAEEAAVDAGTVEAADADTGRGPLAAIATAIQEPPPTPIEAVEPPGTTLKVEVTPVADARVQVQLLTEAEATLYEARSDVGAALLLRNVGVRAKDRVVYLVVKSAWTGTGKEARRGYDAETPYTVTVSEEPAGANAEIEPNDELARATQLPRDGFREGFLAPRGDADVFVLRSERPVLARFEASGVDRVDLELAVLTRKDDGKEEVALKSNDGDVKEPEILNNVYCPGECWVRVQSASRKVDGKWVRDSENAEQPYRLSVSAVPDTGIEEREPNDDAASRATPLQPGRPMRGTIHPRRDVDFYSVDLSDRMVRTPLRATLTGILKVDLGLYLHRVEDDGTLTLVQTADKAKGDQPESIEYSAEPGRYVFEVRDSSKRADANFQDRYQLTVHD
ncbi:MAG: ABC transporter substrate-binding protein [Myxococcaceae bacterium]